VTATLGTITGPGPFAVLAGIVVVLLLVDLFLFAHGREPGFREGVVWSIGWFALSFFAALPVYWLDGEESAINYTTVYLIERSLSLDNLFVFLLLFAYFGVPTRHRANLLFWGIVAAIVMRALAIFGGVELIERFHFVIYILGVTLLVLAWRILQGVSEQVDPDRNIFVRLVRRFYPVTSGFRDGRWFVREDDRTHATPMLLAFGSVVVADIAFAIDSIPAAFAITTDSFAIVAANGFALLGLRSLFVLVEGLIRRFRYLDETIAVVLALVAVKILIEDLVKIGPVTSLAMVAAAFAIGMTASVIADRRDPGPGPDAAEPAADPAEV
jgi:tellurite resistance protein TerC